MRFNESQLNKPANDGKQKKDKPQPGSYTSKDLENAKKRPFLGGR